MSQLIRVEASRGEVGASQLIPLPELPGVRVREAAPGDPGDLAFIDALRKMHSKAVGWMPTGQLVGHIEKGHVLVAEAMGVRDEGPGVRGEGVHPPSSLAPDPSPLPIGYCIGVDKYFKREDTGIIYQMNVLPGSQRGLVGATLLKAMFERWPWGVRLCCCWCAQDLEANRFWEAMGFVPLAFRTGGRGRRSEEARATSAGRGGRGGRIHIFWQKAIRAREVDARWWYPSQTGAGAIKENRIVLPIPPGTHWSDAKPRVLPGMAALMDEVAAQRRAVEGPVEADVRARRRREAKARKEAEAVRAARVVRPAEAGAGGLWFGAAPEKREDTKARREGGSGEEEAGRKVKKRAVKNDPRLVAAAREFRDRWMAAVNDGVGGDIRLEARGKYEVAREVARREVPGEAVSMRNVEDRLRNAKGELPGARRLEAA